MITPPTYTSLDEYRASLGDVDHWHPSLTDILRRHELFDPRIEPAPGFNVTYPTFICGDVVVKLFGYLPASRSSFRFERAAQALVPTDPEIAAPRLIADGQLFPDAGDQWPYLITTKMAGVASWRADLSANQRHALAADLGRQVRRIQELPALRIATDEDWATVDPTFAAGQSSLPPHLVAQVGDYLSRAGPLDRVIVHCDIVANHVYVEDGRITGIIDWGDALVTDRHVELIQIYRDMLGCDKALFQDFLEASDWPVDRDFPRKAMAFALHRQALGFAQHPSIDVFEPIAEKYPLQDVTTLDELAEELFAV